MGFPNKNMVHFVVNRNKQVPKKRNQNAIYLFRTVRKYRHRPNGVESEGSTIVCGALCVTFTKPRGVYFLIDAYN